MTVIEPKPDIDSSPQLAGFTPVVRGAYRHREVLDRFLADYGKKDSLFFDPITGVQHDQMRRTVYGPNSGTILAVRSSSQPGLAEDLRYYVAEINVRDLNPRAIRRGIVDAKRRIDTREPALTLYIAPAHEGGPEEVLELHDRAPQMVGAVPVAHLFDLEGRINEGLHTIARLQNERDQYAQIRERLAVS